MIELVRLNELIRMPDHGLAAKSAPVRMCRGRVMPFRRQGTVPREKDKVLLQKN